MTTAVDMSEVFGLTRDREPTPTVRKESGPPVQYSSLPFRKYVPPELPEPEPESLHRAEWRERFASLGIRAAELPYDTPEGPRWVARLGIDETRRRLFGISLETGSWTESGTLRRDRPWEQLPARVEELLAGNITGAAEVISGPPETIAELPRSITPPAEPPEVLWLRECARRGVELEEPSPSGSVRGLYRGIELWLLPDRRLVQYGRREAGGRTYNHHPLAEALRLADAEFGPPAAKPAGRGLLFV